MLCCGLLVALPWLWFNRALLPSLTGTTLLPFDNLYAFEPYKSVRPDIVPHNPLISDLVLQSVPWALHIRRALAHATVPLWNPDLFAGVPFLAADQPAVLYPFSLVLVLLPVADGFGVFIALHLALLAIGMFAFGRTLGWTRPAALFAAVAFTYGGFSITSVTFPQVIASVAWTPLVLAIVERLLQGSARVSVWIAGVVCIALQILAGHIEMAFYSALFVSLYTALRLCMIVYQARSASVAMARGVIVVTLVGLGAGLGAVQIVPFKEVLEGSVRVGAQSPESVLALAWPLAQLWTLILPDLFGNPVHRSWLDVTSLSFQASVEGQPIFWGTKNYVEGGQYLGVVTLLLAGIGVVRGRRDTVLVFGGLGALSLLLVLGAPIYRLILLVPGSDGLRTPFRWAFPLSLCVSVLAGAGVDVLYRGAPLKRPVPVVLGGLGLLVLSAVALSAVAREPYQRIARRLVTDTVWGERVFGDAAHNLARVFPQPAMFWGYETPGLLRLGIVLVATAIVLRLLARRPTFGAGLAICLVWLELWSVHGEFFPQTDMSLSPLMSRPPIVAALSERPADGQPWRFTTVDFGDEKTFLANVGMYTDWQDIRGYDSIIPRQYASFTTRLGLRKEALDYNRIAPIYDPDVVGSRLLDLLNVRYVISEHRLQTATLREVYHDDHTYAYESATVLPRAFISPVARVIPVADQPLERLEPLDVVYLDSEPPQGLAEDGGRGTARVAEYGPNSVIIHSTVDAPAWVVLADSFAPGWRATLDREDGSDHLDADVVRAYGALRAVHLPSAGKYTVRFWYAPESVRLGGFVSVLSAALVVAAAGAWILVRNKKTGQASDRSARRRRPRALYSPVGRGA